jgi:hypothetical protein
MWWLFVWRAAVGGAVIGGVAGFVVGFILALAGLAEYVLIVTGVTGYALGLVWSTFVLRMMLRKRYADFRLALVQIVGANDHPTEQSRSTGKWGVP